MTTMTDDKEPKKFHHSIQRLLCQTQRNQASCPVIHSANYQAIIVISLWSIYVSAYC